MTYTYDYQCFYPGKKPIDIMNAKSTYDAQLRAAVLWRIPDNKRYKITVVLTQVEGRPITHVATE